MQSTWLLDKYNSKCNQHVLNKHYNKCNNVTPDKHNMTLASPKHTHKIKPDAKYNKCRCWPYANYNKFRCRNLC